MNNTKEYIGSAKWFVMGFAGTRLLEFPIQLAVLYPYAVLFWLLGIVPPEERDSFLREIPETLWLDYTAFFSRGFYWTLWVFAGIAASGVHYFAKHSPSSKALLFIGYMLICLSIYGCIILYFGLPYRWPPMDFLVLPSYVVAQFCVGILLTPFVNRIYNYLQMTRLADIFRRWREG
ncbi:MAG: hypothetical protein KatS3mg019_0121 [Fimbriimonadales bacterium]|nr:MAG: hypothetical protein KatS3mg019_0121 [Fimbriimonadales bacterium]